MQPLSVDGATVIKKFRNEKFNLCEVFIIQARRRQIISGSYTKKLGAIYMKLLGKAGKVTGWQKVRGD